MIGCEPRDAGIPLDTGQILVTALQAFLSSVEVNAPRRRPLALPPAPRPRAPLHAPAPAQYVHMLPILRERAAHMPYQYLESFKTIFLAILRFWGLGTRREGRTTRCIESYDHQTRLTWRVMIVGGVSFLWSRALERPYCTRVGCSRFSTSLSFTSLIRLGVLSPALI